jgi:hypothetical protein
VAVVINFFEKKLCQLKEKEKKKKKNLFAPLIQPALVAALDDPADAARPDLAHKHDPRARGRRRRELCRARAACRQVDAWAKPPGVAAVAAQGDDRGRRERALHDEAQQRRRPRPVQHEHRGRPEIDNVDEPVVAAAAAAAAVVVVVVGVGVAVACQGCLGRELGRAALGGVRGVGAAGQRVDAAHRERVAALAAQELVDRREHVAAARDELDARRRVLPMLPMLLLLLLRVVAVAAVQRADRDATTVPGAAALGEQAAVLARCASDASRRRAPAAVAAELPDVAPEGLAPHVRRPRGVVRGPRAADGAALVNVDDDAHQPQQLGLARKVRHVRHGGAVRHGRIVPRARLGQPGNAHTHTHTHTKK